MTRSDAPPPTRRHRVREQALGEILRTARRLLVEEGQTAVTLRAIAREMGMTAPGLYRYYANHQDLIQALASHLYDELATSLAAARDRQPEDGPGPRMRAVCAELRRWALAHPREFGLLFAKPLTDAATDPDRPAHDAGWRFGGVVLELMVRLWQRGGVTPPEDLDPAWITQLEEVREHLAGEPVPLEVLYVFVACWTRLFGTVAVEAFGHLDFALTDAEPLFTRVVDEIMTALGEGTG
ncbi:TetR/AcrR family transcriptional regulator [Streptomyces sp. SKN60]|uniref:TetR/AcrR family transcriptional regulator n=1 Tax=Streptomyces sp. SKN60 TaxID=2855506 RepID=UPI0022461434|nr:TetR/AcrR family transcriptional regulator [Streptomyces sp. SKN60]MCX2183873.1 TetR/AcrR family transcriptional regulator [Streptomyces sp. SKN60]